MLAETLTFVCCCSLLAASATTDRGSDARTQRFRGGASNAPWFYAASTGAPAASSSRSSCCGSAPSSSPSPSTDAVETEGYGVIHNPQEIPLSFIKELNKVKNVSELFIKFMPNTDMYKAQNLIAMTSVQSRNAPSIERKALTIPKPAGCAIENQTIKLKDTDDPSLYYYPPCTRVGRCEGCCNHDLLACLPTKIETLQFEVMVSQYNEEGRFKFIGRKQISIEQHLKCKCDCIIQQKDCNLFQDYDPNECRCKCKNEDDYEKCNEEHTLKLWNPAMCTCQCREQLDCSSGAIFDPNTCRCEARRQKKPNEFKKNTYSIVES